MIAACGQAESSNARLVQPAALVLQQRHSPAEVIEGPPPSSGSIAGLAMSPAGLLAPGGTGAFSARTASTFRPGLRKRPTSNCCALLQSSPDPTLLPFN